MAGIALMVTVAAFNGVFGRDNIDGHGRGVNGLDGSDNIDGRGRGVQLNARTAMIDGAMTLIASASPRDTDKPANPIV